MHTFRQRTLVLLKALMLQKKVHATRTVAHSPRTLLMKRHVDHVLRSSGRAAVYISVLTDHSCAWYASRLLVTFTSG